MHTAFAFKNRITIIFNSSNKLLQSDAEARADEPQTKALVLSCDIDLVEFCS